MAKQESQEMTRQGRTELIRHLASVQGSLSRVQDSSGCPLDTTHLDGLAFTGLKYGQYFLKSPIPTCIWQRFGDSFILVDHNRAAGDMTDGTIQQYIGKDISEVLGDEPEVLELVFESYHRQTTIRRELFRKPKFTSQALFFDMSFAYIEPDSVMVTLEDITRRKQAEEKLQEAYEQLEQRVMERTQELNRTNIELQSEIAERMRMEAAVRESEKRYRSQFEDSMAIMMIIDSRDGRIIDANPSACRFYGYPRPVLSAMKIYEINTIPPKELEREIQKAKDARSNYFVFRHRMANGQVRDVEVYSSPIKLEKGEALLSIIHDITERKKAEEKARRHQEELAHASRLISIGELASGLAHELNQPLCAILTHSEGCLSLLGSENTNHEKLRAKLTTVVKQADRAGDIINGIKGFIRKESPVKKELDINKVILESLRFFETAARHQEVRIETVLGKSLPKVFADRVQIEQVLINLAQNGCEAMKGVEKKKRTLMIHSCLIPRGDIEIAVRDNGPGLDQEICDRIFEPFFTTKQKGLGLGLSITKTIVENHGGKIRAQRHDNGGAEISFTLPACKEGM